MAQKIEYQRNIIISGVRIGNKVLKSLQIYSYIRFFTFKVSCSQHYLTVGIQLLQHKEWGPDFYVEKR